jgi:hypothetical protein
VSTPEDIARNEHAPITRAEAPVSGISLPAHLGVGTDLVDPIDYVVLIQVMFDVSSGRQITPVLVWQRLQERGIRSTKHRSELVGRNAVYDAFGRIIEAGYMQRYNLPNEKHPGRKGPVGYRVYDNPAWNPEWQAHQVGSDPLQPHADGSTKPQVGMLPQYRDDLKPKESRDGNAAGRNASPVPGSPVPGSQNQGSGGRGIPAGRNASPVPGSPPHPLGGGTTPPPNPLTHAEGPEEHLSQTEGEGEVFDQKDIEAAAAFLQQLPDPWLIGQKDAIDMAPELLAQMQLKQWPCIHTVNRKQLTDCLATNPGGANNLPSILRRRRIPNLPAYNRVADRADARRAVPKQMPAASAVVECDKGCDRGYIEIDDRVAPCECLPLRQASAL